KSRVMGTGGRAAEGKFPVRGSLPYTTASSGFLKQWEHGLTHVANLGPAAGEVQLMVQVTMNGKPVRRFSSWDERLVHLGTGAKPEVAGVALSAGDVIAIQKYDFRVAMPIAVAVIWLLVGLVFIFPVHGEPFVRPYALGLGLLTPIMILVIRPFTLKRWVAKLPQRMQGAPPPRTSIRLDASGLAIGECYAGWSVVFVNPFDFITHPVTFYMAVSLFVRAPGFSFLLDRPLLKNGPAIVNKIYRRKCRPVLRGQ